MWKLGDDWKLRNEWVQKVKGCWCPENPFRNIPINFNDFAWRNSVHCSTLLTSIIEFAMQKLLWFHHRRTRKNIEKQFETIKILYWYTWTWLKLLNNFESDRKSRWSLCRVVTLKIISQFDSSHCGWLWNWPVRKGEESRMMKIWLTGTTLNVIIEELKLNLKLEETIINL